MSKKILILNDGRNYQNWGIQACIDGLEVILKSKASDLSIARLSHSFMHKKYNIEPKVLGRKLFTEDSRIMKRFFNQYHNLPKIADEFEYIAELWLKGKGGKGVQEFLNKVNDVDLVIFNAEGSTYRNNIGAIKGLFMLWFSKKILGKKSAFLNGSVTLSHVDPILPAMVKKVFNEIDLVGIREPFSYKNVTEFYPELSEKMHIFPDSVFALDIEKEKIQNNIDINTPFFALSLSMLPMDYRNMKNSELVNLIRKLKKIVPQAVLFAKDEEDRMLRKIAKATSSIFIGSEYSYHDVEAILSNAAFLVSGRYHHVIFATKVGCPIIPLATSSHKLHGLSSLFKGLMREPADPTDLKEEMNVIVKEADNIIKQGQPLRHAYEKRAEELKEKSLEQSSYVYSILFS